MMTDADGDAESASDPDQALDPITATVKNVGGIEAAEATLLPGVTVLAGENATNRTSFLRALATGLGGDVATVKSDAEAGRVRVTVGGETYERTLRRRSDGRTAVDGPGYADEAAGAALFAWLFVDNEIRAAFRSGDPDLRDLAMRPVDTDAIEREIRELRRERDRIDDELDAARERAERLPALDERVTELETEVEALEAEVEAAREAAEAAAKGEEEDDAGDDGPAAELREARSELARVESRIDRREGALAELEAELSEARDELAAVREELSGVDVDPEAIRETVRELQDERDRLADARDRLDTVLEVGEALVGNGGDAALWELIRPDAGPDGRADDPALPDRLADDAPARLACPTCGSTVERNRIETRLDRLRERRRELVARDGELADEIETARNRREAHARLRDRRDSLEARVAQLESDLADRREALAEARDRRADLESRIANLEAEVADTEGDEEDDGAAARRRLSEAEVELDRARRDLEEARTEREAVAADADRIDDLETEREAVADDLAAARDRVRRLEAGVVETFNAQMETLLDRLAYANLERVWLERITDNSGGSGGLGGSGGREAAASFRLHVVRTAADGATYEDRLDTLSESEREVVAIAFALAGYRVHGVDEQMPVILLDGVEMIDADRLDRLLDVLGDAADYVVAALLPADARIAAADRRTVEFGGEEGRDTDADGENDGGDSTADEPAVESPAADADPDG